VQGRCHGEQSLPQAGRRIHQHQVAGVEEVLDERRLLRFGRELRSDDLVPGPHNRQLKEIEVFQITD
jgi:hypothetical protein